MTQEDKSILFKDLCARLPYGVILSVTLKDKYDDIVNRNIELTEYNLGYITKASNWQECKPHLRPMSSMTEEEKKKLWELLKRLGMTADVKRLDWLVAHHFDIRNLIGKGLALEAPEGMYDLKDK